MVSQCSYSDINMTEYEAAKTDLPGVEALDSERQKLIDDVGYTDEEIQKVSEKKEEIVTAYIRRKEGEAKIRKLGGIIIGGLSMLCPLALSFTMPQMILSCSISGISVLYNTDQYLQGLQLLDAAETRNTNAEIDKIVDFHNETLNEGYEIIGTITTAYCGTLMMGTLTYSLGGGNVSFLSATADTGEDLLTDCIAGNIDEALGGGSPLRSMLISSVLSGGISASKGKIAGGGTKQTVSAPDAADVRKAVDIDAPDVRNAVNNIDAPDVKNAVNSIDAPDVKTATNVKEPIAGTRQGNIQSEIKVDTQTAIDVKSQSVVSGKGIESGSKAIGIDELVVRDTKFLDADGNINWEKWAPNGGRVLETIKGNQTIPAGTIIDRYGSQWGKYTSPVGVSYEQRALPYIENPNAYHKYEVLKPIDNVTISEIAPAFEQVGGGIQYELPNNIKELEKLGYIKEII